MLARYISLAQRLRQPAIVFTSSGSVTVNSAAAFGLASESVDRLISICRTTVNDARLRIDAIDGREFCIAPLFDEQSQPEAALAVAERIVELPKLLQAFQEPLRSFGRIVHELPQPLAVARPDGRFDFFNARWRATFGTLPHGDGDEAFFAPFIENERHAAVAEWRRGLAVGRAFSFRRRLRTLTGPCWFQIDIRPIHTGSRTLKWIVTLGDIEEEVRALHALQRSEGDLRLIATASAAFERARQPADLQAALDAIGTQRGESWRLLASEAAGAAAVHRSALKLPVDAGGQTVRLVVHGVDEGDVHDRSAHLAQDVAVRLGHVLTRWKTSERERRIAESLQRAMLPADLPRLAGLRSDVVYTPADTAMFVGGDWYDVFPLGDLRIGFTLGDVTGHGTEAAILMGAIRHMIRASARENDDPTWVLARVNGLLNSERTYASAVFGTLDLLTGDLTFANAGHLPPLLVRDDSTVSRLWSDGLLLGVEDTLELGVRRQRLRRGDALVLYTDGLVEWGRDTVAAEASLIAELERWARRDFAGSLDAVHRSVIGGTVDDDVAVMALRLEPQPGIDAVVSATTRNASRLRHAVERLLEPLDLEADTAFEITLAIAEAVNNAAEHAYGGDTGPVHLRVQTTRDAVRAEISDQGSWGARSSRHRGRGLEIIRTLVPDAFIRHDATGTRVSLTFPLRHDGHHGSTPRVTASINHGS